jgi:hypothetical protein
MSTKLNQFGLTWNLSNNSKSVETQRKLQLQKLFQIIPSSATNFSVFFSIYSYFYGAIFIQKCFNPEKVRPLDPICWPPHFRPGLPIGCHWACRRRTPTESSAPPAFKDATVLTGPDRHCHLISTVSAVALLCVSHRRSSLSHRPFTSLRSTSLCHPVVARLPHQHHPVLPLRHRRAHATSLLGSPAPPSSESPTSSSLTHR